MADGDAWGAARDLSRWNAEPVNPPDPTARPTSPTTPFSTGFVARATLIVLALWALAHVLWAGRELLFVAFLAALVAAFLSIFVDRLQAVGAPRTVATLTVLVVVLALVVGGWTLAWPTLQEQFQIISLQLPATLAEIVYWLQDQLGFLFVEWGNGDPEFWDQLRTRIGEELTNIVAGALPLLNTVAGAVAGTLVVVFTGVFLAIEPQLYLNGFIRLVPPANRHRVEDTLRGVGNSLRRWMLGTVINMAVIGVATTLGLWLLDVPAALALGILAAILEFIPIFGPILSAVPAVAVALIVSPTLALYVVLLYVAVQQLESNLLTPLVMRGAVQLPPALTIVFQAMMAVLFGFLGLLLAVPILAALIVAIQRLYVEPIETSAEP